MRANPLVASGPLSAQEFAVRPHLTSRRRVALGLIVATLAANLAIVLGAAAGVQPAGAASSGHDDTVYAFGTASFHGSTSGKHLNSPIVGMAPTANGKGY